MPKKRKKTNRHNKKRNTAFLFEALIREATRCVLNKDESGKKEALSLCVEFFNKRTVLFKELELYKTLTETSSLDEKTAEKFLSEAKRQYTLINKERVFKEQSLLIQRINEQMSGRPFSYFMPNYKNLASISQIFNNIGSVKERVLLEKTIVENLSSRKPISEDDKMVTLDELSFKTFIGKYNEKYTGLLPEQRVLMSKYILSFRDNGLELKVYLNEELGRLKGEVGNLVENKEIKKDEDMTKKVKLVSNLIEGFKEHQIDEKMINSVFKIQSLINESGGGE